MCECACVRGKGRRTSSPAWAGCGEVPDPETIVHGRGKGRDWTMRGGNGSKEDEKVDREGPGELHHVGRPRRA